MGHDNYCLLTGGTHLESGQVVRESILWHLNEAINDQMAECGELTGARSEDEELQMLPLQLSGELMKGLCYSEYDVEGSRLLVLLSFYEEDEEGYEVVDHFGVNNFPDSTPENIMPVFNVVPGDMPDLGDFVDKDDPEVRYTMSPISSTISVTHASYIIAQEASPRLEPHILHAVLRKRRLALDYGGLRAIQDQYVDWSAIYSLEREPSGREEFWYNLLVRGDKTDEQRLYDAWKGPGMMWMMVRPDRFPVAETLEEIQEKNANKPHQIVSLPPELILMIFEFLHPKDLRALLSTSKSMRSALRKFTDRYVFDRMSQDEPWYLPAGPFDFQGGSQEVDWWNEQWAKKGHITEDSESGGHHADLDVEIPWLNYRHACSHSMSMWNRIRIWRVIKQVEAVALQENLISEDNDE